MLTKDQYKVLDSLASIKLHNSNRKNLKIRFQTSRFASKDISFLTENGFIKINLAQEYYLTEASIKELKNKY
jgi:hypothetical protein